MPSSATQPTIKDVAREAGVSTATVSRVLNGIGRVAESTRRRVLQAIDRLNYSPNLVARSLVSRGTKTLALFVPDIMNPFFTAVARGVADAVGVSGYAVVLCNTEGTLDGHSRYVGLLRGNFVDGVILCGTAGRPDAFPALIPAGLPVVVVDGRIPGLGADSVQVNNRAGGALATEHLVGLGCERILHLGGPEGVGTAEERWAGYREVLGDRYDDRLVTRGPFRAESGYARTRAALDRGVVFDAIFAANDLLALGAVQALAETGRRVPDDVRVIGFDDIYMASLAQPPLSTVAQPTYRMGAMAGRMLIERIAPVAGPAPVRDVVLEPVLRIRESTRRK